MKNFPAVLNPNANLSNAFPFSSRSPNSSGGSVGSLGVPVPTYNASNEAGNASNLAGQALRGLRNGGSSNSIFSGQG
jgi:hypothetical protein